MGNVSCSRGMTEHHLSRHPGKELLSAARMLALQQTERLEAMSEERDYCESLLHEAAELQNEHYTDRWAHHCCSPCCA